METMIQTLLAFVGTMLAFALVAQSLQELLKTMLVIKGKTLKTAIEGLVREATRANRQWTVDADAILRQLITRIGALGQQGVFPGKIRLDAIPPEQLESLICKIEPADVPGLPGDRDQALAILRSIAAQAREWYPIAVAPVDDRYRRRMRVLTIITSALVVLPFNLDAIRVLTVAQRNPQFRAQAVALATRLDSTYRASIDSARARQPLPDSDPVARDSSDTAGAVVATTADTTPPAKPVLSVSEVQEIRRLYSEELLGRFEFANLRLPRWWLGTLLSILLVSLGAPFWHDLLESLFGLKSRLGKPTPDQE